MGFVTPSTCFHSYTEEYFEVNPSDKISCGDCCSYCIGDVEFYGGRFYKRQLTSILTANVFSDEKTHYKAFIKTLKEKEDILVHEDDKPGSLMGPIHALALQLLSTGIISFGIKNHRKIGEAKILNDTHIIMNLPAASTSDCVHASIFP